ncbi:MAG: alkaline phosphatase family protein, partial [Planctomycetota bacterium]
PAFWEVMAEQGVPAYVHRMPASYPLTETTATVFPDMGMPDLAGALSGISYLWTENPWQGDSLTGESYHVETIKMNRRNADMWLKWSKLYGPPLTILNVDDLKAQVADAIAVGENEKANSLQKEIERKQELSVPIALMVDNTGDAPQLAVQIEGEYATAGLGEWSNWVQVEFSDFMGGMMPITGYTRFRFLSAEPFEAYALPIQLDPFVGGGISMPEGASAELAEAIGPYIVQGFADAYKSYKAELLDTDGFLNQSDMVLEERTRMMHYGLDQVEESGGLLFLYTGSLDMRCHMLWHLQDEEHPHQEAPGDYLGVPFDEQIDRIYVQVDQMLGEMVARIEKMESETGESVELIVMSDHGFAPFRRKMHINDWLVQEGYLVLKDGAASAPNLMYEVDAEGHPKLGSGPVDWSKSKAYCVGFNGIILNRMGREAEGIVTEAEADALLAEITGKLLALEDGGRPVFTKVLPATEVFSGPEEVLELAPDLQLGFNTEFGASDECATGGVVGGLEPGNCMVDNDSRWSGSHLMDPELVRGTIISRSGKSFSKDPALEDITATLYSLFDVTPPEGMDGRPLY